MTPGTDGATLMVDRPTTSLLMPDQIKFEIICDPPFAQALDDLGSRLGKTRSEIIQDGLSFYNEAVRKSVFHKWEENNDSAKADEKNRLIDALEEAVKEAIKASKELDVAKQARKEAVEKERDAYERLNDFTEKRNQLELDLQNFFYRLHSTKFAQEQEQ